MNVPFLDLKRLHDTIRSELDAAIAYVVDTNAFIGGGASGFEERFAEAHGVAGAAGCASGTDALLLALLAFGIGPGDDVIVPAMTFIATAEAVVLAGARPVLADVDPETLLLTADEVARVRTDATKAVIPVHLYGHVVPADDLRAMRHSGLVVVEDAAQAHLGSADGHVVGSIGHAAAFSFYPGKNFGAFGDAGAVISNDDGALEEIRRLRDHGRTSKYEHDIMAMNSRLDGIQAAVLRVKLRYLDEWTSSRQSLADRYRRLLGDLVVPWTEGAVHHLLVMRHHDRDGVAAALHTADVGTGIHYPIALSGQPAMRRWAVPCPHSEAAATTVLSLPMDPLMKEDQVDQVCEAVARHVGR